MWMCFSFPKLFGTPCVHASASSAPEPNRANSLAKFAFELPLFFSLAEVKAVSRTKLKRGATPTATSDTIETTKDAKSGSRIDAEYSFIIFNCSFFFVRRCENK